MQRHRLAAHPDPADLARVTRDFRALADPTRVRLLVHLADGEQSVGALVAALGAPQSTVSRHLAVLRHADLVRARREGASVRYHLATSHVRALLREAFAHAEHERLGWADGDRAGAGGDARVHGPAREAP